MSQLYEQSIRTQMQLLQIHKIGIIAAEYWIQRLLRAELAQPNHALLKARKRLAKCRVLMAGGSHE